MSSRWDTSRTEAFSDGVFAIAITLLVLDLAVPSEELHHLAHGILHQWPSYLAYLTSFVTIGGLWLAHHGIFSRLRFVDSRVMRINLLLLLFVSFLPYPTRLMAEAIRDSNAERTAVIFYGLALTVVSFTMAALWAAALRDRELLKPEVDEAEIKAMTLASAPNVGSPPRRHRARDTRRPGPRPSCTWRSPSWRSSGPAPTPPPSRPASRRCRPIDQYARAA